MKTRPEKKTCTKSTITDSERWYAIL